MLSLPFAFSLVGVIPGTGLVLIAATMAGFGLHLLTKACNLVCNRAGSFAALASHTYPKLSPVFDLAIALKCTGVAISYLTIIADLIPETMRAFTGDSSEVVAGKWYS